MKYLSVWFSTGLHLFFNVLVCFYHGDILSWSSSFLLQSWVAVLAWSRAARLGLLFTLTLEASFISFLYWISTCLPLLVHSLGFVTSGVMVDRSKFLSVLAWLKRHFSTFLFMLVWLEIELSVKNNIFSFSILKSLLYCLPGPNVSIGNFNTL